VRWDHGGEGCFPANYPPRVASSATRLTLVTRGALRIRRRASLIRFKDDDGQIAVWDPNLFAEFVLRLSLPGLVFSKTVAVREN
jgi:hypothetical protein